MYAILDKNTGIVNDFGEKCALSDDGLYVTVDSIYGYQVIFALDGFDILELTDGQIGSYIRAFWLYSGGKFVKNPDFADDTAEAESETAGEREMLGERIAQLESLIADLYAGQVESGSRTLETVPELVRNAVEAQTVSLAVPRKSLN